MGECENSTTLKPVRYLNILPVWGSRWVCKRPPRWRAPESPVGFCSWGRDWAAPSPRCWCSGTQAPPTHRETRMMKLFYTFLSQLSLHLCTNRPWSKMICWNTRCLVMADLLVGDFSGRQLLPTEQQRVCHLSERVQVNQPHSPLQHTHTHTQKEMSETRFARGAFIDLFIKQNSWMCLPGCLYRHQTQLQNKKLCINHWTSEGLTFILHQLVSQRQSKKLSKCICICVTTMPKQGQADHYNSSDGEDNNSYNPNRVHLLDQFRLRESCV